MASRPAAVAALALAVAACGGRHGPTTTATPGGPSAPAREPGIDAEVARLFTHPYPEGEVPWGFLWSPDGRRLVYQRLEGSGDDVYPQIWLVDAATGEEQVLWDHPDRTAGQVEWFPDGEWLMLDAGGELLSLEARSGAEPEILNGTSTSEHQGARLSPDGRRVAFVSGHDLTSVSLERGVQRRLTTDGSETVLNGEVDWVYDEELELDRGFWWSPDSRRIAYVQFDESRVTAYPVVVPTSPTPTVVRQRYPQAGETNPTVRLGVVDVDGAGEPATVWLDSGAPADGYLARVGWTPSGDAIFTVTLDRLQRVLRLNLVDPTGRTSPRVVLEERDDRWLNVLGEPRFLGNGSRFLWRSERDGHAHLYVYDLQGRLEAQVTRGEWEVSAVASVDERAGLVYFVGNREGPATYQLYAVPLGGGEVRRISRLAGRHDPTFAPGSERYVDVHSSLERPPRAELFGAGGESVRVLAERDLSVFPDLDLTTAEMVTVPGSEGRQYQAQMVRPARLEPGQRYPALVWVYNGPAAQLACDEWRTKYLPWMRLMARRGVVVFSMDGRGTQGRGREWETPVYRDLGTVELEDQMDGVTYLRSLDFVDPERIGIFGWSYGGTMVLHALLRRPGEFRVGVSVAPVTSWLLYDTIYTERYMMTPRDNPIGYDSTAPLRHADQLRDPLLLVHGLSDDNVHFRNTESMIEALVAAGRRFDVMVYPGESHGIATPLARRHVFSTITSYLLEHLLDAE